MVQAWKDFERDGSALLPAVFDSIELATLIEAISSIDQKDGVRSRGGIYAIRNLLHLSSVARSLAHLPKVCGIVRDHLVLVAFPVRGTLFDKTPGANWLVPWHQDLTICVAARIDLPGYGPWTTKAGVCHVQPPAAILQAILSIRIHLDDCDESNGALRVLPGTHRLGRLTPRQIEEHQRSAEPVLSPVAAGGVLVMRPLLLHASSAASNAAHRRVIHIDYASSELDGGLRWSTPSTS